jgi:hypothetical protein
MKKNKYDDYSKTQEDPSLGLELSIVAIVITFIMLFNIYKAFTQTLPIKPQFMSEVDYKDKKFLLKNMKQFLDNVISLQKTVTKSSPINSLASKNVSS